MTQWTISLVPELALSAIKIDIPMDSLSRESLPVNYWGFGAIEDHRGKAHNLCRAQWGRFYFSTCYLGPSPR
jgi:hypothetical protein